MNLRRLLLVTPLVLSACTALQQAPLDNTPPSPSTPREALETANDLIDKGMWTDALGILDTAIARFPADDRLVAEKQSVLQRRERRRRYLEDQILASDAENQKKQIHWLEQLAQVQPDNLVLLSRQLYWEKILADKLEPLIECAEYHAERDTSLARRCFTLTAGLPVPAPSESRLALVDKKLRAIEKIIAEKRRAKEEKARQDKVNALLEKARHANASQHYRKSLDILDEAAELQPENPEALKLRQQAWDMLKPQIEVLIKLGDRLYLNDQLEAAVGTWQAALTLNPDNEEIMARIERARTVIERLKTLREQQKEGTRKK